METIKDKPAVRLKPSSYQPSKAEMEEDIGIDTTPRISCVPSCAT